MSSDPAPHARATGNRTTPEQKLSVLVVDDVRDIADTLALFVRVRGHEASVAYSAEAALELARQQGPDVVFLDLAMPSFDGLELAQALRAQFGPEPLLVAMTGVQSSATHEAARSAGCDHVLLKPIQAEVYDHILEIAVRRRVRALADLGSQQSA